MIRTQLKNRLLLKSIRKNNEEVSRLLILGKKRKYPFQALSNEEHIELSLSWFLKLQQYHNDGGMPAKYSLLHCEDTPIYPSYPETSGYILSTLIAYNNFYDANIDNVIREMKDFLLTKQLKNGAFTGGHSKMNNFEMPSIFNSGQILLGLCSYYTSFKKDDELKKVIINCSNWIKSQIDKNGQYNTNYTFRKKERAYYSRATYGLLRAAELVNDDEGLEAAKRNFEWVYLNGKENGWINKWGFNDQWAVLHTIAYTLRGMLEAGMYFNEEKYIALIEKSLDKILQHKVSWGNEFLITSLIKNDFTKVRQEICLTGLCQLSIILFKFGNYINNAKYIKYADEIISNVKKFQLRGFENEYLNGGLTGSWPIGGKYQPYDIVNWSVKFFLDGLLLSKGIDYNSIDG